MSVEWRMDYGDIERSLEKYEDIDTLALEAALVTVFQATQNAVHVITGKMKASGRVESSGDGESWEGTITYGGPGSIAPYASFEAARGGEHDPLMMARTMDYVIGVAFRTALED